MFTPSEFTPTGVGIYQDISAQFSPHFLSNVTSNPASLSRITSENYLYVDFKTNRQEEFYTYDPRVYDTFSNSLYAPISQTYTVREPVISAAFFSTPFENKKYTLGATYQLIDIKDSFYRSGRPYFWPYYGPVLANASSYSIESRLTQRVNETNHTGHFMSFINSYKLSEELSLGFKIGYNTYTSFGNSIPGNPVTDLPVINYTIGGYNYNKNQDYSHWDLSAGLTYITSENSNGGISFGLLKGNFEHQENSRSSYNSNYFDESSNYVSLRSNSSSQERNISSSDGITLYTNLNYYLNLTGSSSSEIVYKLQRKTQDFGYGLIRNSSGFYDETYINGSDIEINSVYNNDGNSSAFGAGKNITWDHQVSFKYENNFTTRTKLITGFQLNVISFNEDNEELNRSADESRNIAIYPGNEFPDSDQTFIGSQLNTVTTSYSRKQTRSYIPVIVHSKIFDQISVELGVVKSYYKFEAGNTQNYSNTRTETIIDNTNSSEEIENYESTYEYSNDSDSRQNNWNTFGAVIYTPSKTLNFRFQGASSNTYMDIIPYNNQELKRSFNFRISAEIGF